MDLIKGGEARAFVTVHLGGEPAVQAAQFFIRKFQEKSGVKLELRRAVGFDDITRCLQVSLSLSSVDGPGDKAWNTPGMQGRQTIPADGFAADVARVGKDVGVVLSAPSVGCMIMAMGQLLRGIEFGRQEARIVALPPRAFQPEKAVRGVILALPPGGEYAVWPDAELRALFEDWAFWGINTILTRYDMHAFRSDFRSDPEGSGSQLLRRHQAMARMARDLGMKFGLVTVANNAYLDRVMVNLRAHDSRTDPRRGGSPALLCPSAHEGRAFLLQDREEVFQEMEALDLLWLWPLDPGGCWCERCQPWVKTFLGLSQEIARTMKRYHSKAKAYVATRWFLPGEFDILEEYLATEPDWLDGIVLDEADLKRHFRNVADLKRLAARFSEKCPILFSPDISLSPFQAGDRMCFERGRLGASPRIRGMHRQITHLAPFLSGVAPQSETVGDDLTKVAYAQWSSRLGERPEEVVRDYWRWHFDRDTDPGYELVSRLEENAAHLSEAGLAREVKALTQAQKRLLAPVREQWRWRVFAARVELDTLLAGIGFSAEDFAQAASRLRRAARARTRAGMLRSAQEVARALREREKRVENFARAAESLQTRVYRIGPERTASARGLQLAEDCGRGPGRSWIRRIEQAFREKTLAGLKAALLATAREMCP